MLKEKCITETPVIKAFDTDRKVDLVKSRAAELIDEVAFRNPAALVFIDRGGRPISWIFVEAWRKRFPRKKLPPIKYIDLGAVKRKLQEEKLFKTGGVFDKEGEIDSVKARRVFQTAGGDKELLEMLKDFYRQRGPIMLIDDYAGSGRTARFIESFLKYHFPDKEFAFCSFFTEMDAFVLRKPKADEDDDTVWLGPWLPWNTEKEYSLMAGNEAGDVGAKKIIGKPEQDTLKRAKGLALKKEIKEIFKNFN